MATIIKQGDAYPLPVGVTLNGAAIAPEDIETVEFMLGDVRKLYPTDATFNPEDNFFYVNLTQEDTFSLPANSSVNLDVRVKFVGGNVLGIKKMQYATIVDAVSEEVL